MATRDQLPKYLKDFKGPGVHDVTKDQCFRILLRVLRSAPDCQPDHPVRVRRLDPDMSHLKKDHCDGTCHLVNANEPKTQRYFLIELNKKVAWSQMLENLFHEWAHALTWYVENQHDHGAQWSAAYGRIYRLLISD